MAKMLGKTVTVTINGTDLSDRIFEVNTEKVRDEVEVTAFGALAKEFLPGLADATMTISFYQDFAAGEVDAILWPLSDTDTPFPVIIKPTSAAISATNPAYTMQALLYSYSPIAAAVGEALTTEVPFRNADQTGLVRDITP